MKYKRKKLEILLKRYKFAGLMSLYDQNYFLVNRLIPDLALLPDKNVAIIPDSPDLYLQIIERFKFTTTLRLTYYFRLDCDDGENYIADPDLLLRIYHDAQVVEVMSCKPQGFMAIDKKHIAEVKQFHCRWDSNLFLQKWLQYVVETGYRFTLDSVSEFNLEVFQE